MTEQGFDPQLIAVVRQRVAQLAEQLERTKGAADALDEAKDDLDRAAAVLSEAGGHIQAAGVDLSRLTAGLLALEPQTLNERLEAIQAIVAPLEANLVNVSKKVAVLPELERAIGEVHGQLDGLARGQGALRSLVLGAVALSGLTAALAAAAAFM